MSIQIAATPETIAFELNGQPAEALAGESILQVASRLGIEIPHLCYKPGLRVDGNCRVCVVEIEGERTLAPSCFRQPTAGMVVKTDTARARKSQKMVLELLQGDVSDTVYSVNSELQLWCDRLDVKSSRFGTRTQPTFDHSHPAITVNLDACIQCTRCLRACREEQVNDVIGFAGRGADARIVFDLEDKLGESSCVACGECVQACPTGALMSASEFKQPEPERSVDSVCPFCGVGCLLSYQVKDDKITSVTGRDGPANQSRLCVKGRYGFDYIHNPERLRVPLIRKAGVAKGLNEHFDPADWSKMFREASWEEAIALAVGGLKNALDGTGPSALAGFGSAKGSNEEAYLFQKLVRTGFRSNNVDHCTRLCHASSVSALLEGVGSGAVSNQVEDVALADVVIVIGSNPAANHPVAATFIKNAVKNGTKLIMIDPRRTDMARHAHRVLQFKPDTDVALLNAMIHVIVEEGLVNQDFVDSKTSDFDLILANVAAYSPEAMAPICGIDAETIRYVARLYATAKGAMILWGMGVSQHTHGTDNVRCLIALAMMTGQIGRPGCGLHPLRGQNNVQGASDAGLIPMMYPDYQRVDKPEVQAWFSEYWGHELDSKPGLTVVEIMHKAAAGEIEAMYIMGENPAMSDPNLNHARHAMASLKHLVVQDLFLTETAAFADVVLPATAWPEKDGTVTNTDRRVQMGRQAVMPPGDAKPDVWILQQIANGLGLDWQYEHVSDVYEEMRGSMPSITGISWQRLEQEESVTYPCAQEDQPGQGVVFVDGFPTESGRGRFVPASFKPADELPDADYPFVLITGRLLEHWHTGSMTRRAEILDSLEPVPVVTLHPADLQRIGLQAGDQVRMSTRRGEISAFTREDTGMSKGEVFLPFCFHEAAANLLTNEALDPFGKIPEFKFCAVQLESVNVE